MLRLLTCLVVFLSQTSWAALPSISEHTRIGDCVLKGGFLDLTYQTVAETLPVCRTSCGPASEAVAQQCVLPESSQPVRLRFELRERCQVSACSWFGSYKARLKVTTVKIAQLLGIPAEELQSDVLFWSVPDSPASVASPSLNKFLIARRDEPNFPTGRRLDEPWYMLVMAFRVDSLRVRPADAGYKAVVENNGLDLPRYVGADFEVQNVEVSNRNQPDQNFAARDFRSVFEFQNIPRNVFPFGSNEDAQEPLMARPQAAMCLDACHSAAEEALGLPHTCFNDCDCQGARTCTSFGYCAGFSGTCRDAQAPIISAATTSAPPSLPTTRLPNMDVLAERSVPSNVCWVHVVSIVSGEMALGASVALCLLRNLTGGSCSESACAVVQAAISSESCSADLCAESGPLWRWSLSCSDEKVLRAFSTAASRSCAVEEASASTDLNQDAPEDDSGGSGLIIGVLVAAIALCCLCCCAALPAKLLWDHRRQQRLEFHCKEVALPDDPYSGVDVSMSSAQEPGLRLRPASPVVSAQAGLSPNSRPSSGSRKGRGVDRSHSTHNVAVAARGADDDFQSWVNPSEMGGRPKEVNRFQGTASWTSVNSFMTAADRRRLTSATAGMDPAIAAAWEAAGVSLGGSSSSVAPAPPTRDKLQAPDLSVPSYSNRSTNSVTTASFSVSYSQRSALSVPFDEGTGRSRDTASTLTSVGERMRTPSPAPHPPNAAWEEPAAAEDLLDQSSISQSSIFMNIGALLKGKTATPKAPARKLGSADTPPRPKGSINGKARGGHSVADSSPDLRSAAQPLDSTFSGTSEFFPNEKFKPPRQRSVPEAGGLPPPAPTKPSSRSGSRSIPTERWAAHDASTPTRASAPTRASSNPTPPRGAPREGSCDRQPASESAARGPHVESNVGLATAHIDESEEINTPELLAMHLAQLRRSTELAARRRFFLSQCLRWHPDKNVGDEARATRMFQMLQEKKKWFLDE